MLSNIYAVIIQYYFYLRINRLRKQKEVIHMAMYTSDKTERLNLRLTKDQMGFVVKVAEITGLTPSEYLRSAISAMMYGWAKSEEQIEKLAEASDGMAKILGKEEVARLENDKTSINDKL